MSQNDIAQLIARFDRIDVRLTDLGDRLSSVETTVAALDDKVDKYNGLKDRMMAMEAAKTACDASMQAIKDNCAAVQAKKQKRIQPWIALIFTGLGAIIIGLISWIFELLK